MAEQKQASFPPQEQPNEAVKAAQSSQEQQQQTAAKPPKRDSIPGMVLRMLNPLHLAKVAGWCTQTLREDGMEGLRREIKFRVDLATGRDGWEYRADVPSKRELKRQRSQGVPGGPLISVVVPLYNTPLPFLRQMMHSVQNQSYRNWQLVLADASDSQHQEQVMQQVLRLAKEDKRIVYHRLEQNQGIAQNTNQALARAKGDWFVLLDHDDVLYLNALYMVAQQAVQGADFVYSDEIILTADLKNVVSYHFKPDYSPDYLRGCNYITHLSAFSRSLLERAGGGLRPEFDGSQDHDLILRLTEQAKKIVHLPYVLYIWRSHANSTASGMDAKPYALAAGERAIAAHLERAGRAGTVESIPGNPGAYRVRYQLTSHPLVSILIPNKDHVDDLSRCLESLYQFAGYSRFEVIVIENNSTDPATFAYYEEAKKKFSCLQVVRYEGPFNFSAINNFGRKFAKGEQLLLLNNDVELLSPDFLVEMLMYSQRPDVGCVGAKLYYPDDTIQHAGVFLGINSTAGHSHKGHPRESSGDMYRLAVPQNMMAVTGACLMVKTELFDRVGGLDEEAFAVAYNDVDLGLKLWKMGYLNVFTPFAEAYHHESKSRGSDEEGPNAVRYAREKANFIKAYGSLMEQGDPYYNRHLNLKYENYGLR